MKRDEPFLVIKDVHAGYRDVSILNGVSMEVRSGEVVCIIGPNGAGKSTLAKTVFGLLEVRRGKILFRGENLAGLKPSEIVRRGLCYVPQERNVFPNLTVQENLELGGYLLNQEEKRRALARTYDLFPILHDKRNHNAGTLSGGQRQMLAMGRALMLDPVLLVLDEPSAGLAPQMVSGVFRQIENINGQGCAVLMVEQNARRALAFADRAYVLDMGKDVLEGKGSDLLKDAQVVDLYLGAGAGSRDA